MAPRKPAQRSDAPIAPRNGVSPASGLPWACEALFRLVRRQSDDVASFRPARCRRGIPQTSPNRFRINPTNGLQSRTIRRRTAARTIPNRNRHLQIPYFLNLPSRLSRNPRPVISRPHPTYHRLLLPNASPQYHKSSRPRTCAMDGTYRNINDVPKYLWPILKFGRRVCAARDLIFNCDFTRPAALEGDLHSPALEGQPPPPGSSRDRDRAGCCGTIRGSIGYVNRCSSEGNSGNNRLWVTPWVTELAAGVTAGQRDGDAARSANDGGKLGLGPERWSASRARSRHHTHGLRLRGELDLVSFNLVPFSSVTDSPPIEGGHVTGKRPFIMSRMMSRMMSRAM